MPTQPSRQPARSPASADPSLSDVEQLAGQLKKASPMQAVALAQQLASAARTARGAQPKQAASRNAADTARARTDDATLERLLDHASE